jgi:outer membrane protein assembly factor BamD
MRILSDADHPFVLPDPCGSRHGCADRGRHACAANDVPGGWPDRCTGRSSSYRSNADSGTRRRTGTGRDALRHARQGQRPQGKGKQEGRHGGQVQGLDAKLPDKELYDKAIDSIKHGRFDVARLQLQVLLNTYPDSQYQMRAKLAVADSWYREGGSAALTQAEQEYKDFITFFPNVPEAAEAQMRVGDIYFRQMDKPDRDYSKAVHAEQEYRLMLTQFPDSPLVPDAKQRLREVQETLASRESNIADFYAGREAWAAAIARYQTVADTYPEYSHMDEVLIGLGDSYEAESRYVRGLNLPEGPKARLEKIYDDKAIAAYDQVVLDHSAAPHVEDARDRLAALNAPIPVPSKEQVAASEALENSRQQYRLTDRAKLLIFHQPDYVQAARVGEPSLVDPKPTLAPAITKSIVGDFQNAFSAPRPAGEAVPKPSDASAAGVPAQAAAAPAEPATATTPANAAPLQLQEVPTSGNAAADSTNTMTTATAPATVPSGNSLGVEIVQPGSTPSTAPMTQGIPGANAANGTTPVGSRTAVPDGMAAVGPANATPLPAVEKAPPAPDTINDVKPGTEPPAQAPRADGKTTKPAFDKSDESSSKHKKKKGLNKLNPF